MIRRVLLPLAGALVVAVIALQASQLSTLSDRVNDLEGQLERSESRTRAALDMVEQVADALPDEAADEAEAFRLRARLLEKGDPRLLEPTEYKAIETLFDELL